jgi:mannitol-1-/sugar-/sorbitol-6-/2-deoxyglucose-6-phosphatase
MNKIQGVIFDLDGTLIDSEPLWQKAEIRLFGEEGLFLTPDDCRKTMGLQTSEAVRYWLNKILNKKKSVDVLTKELNEIVIGLIKEESNIKDGALEVLELIRNKKIPMAIASSSTIKLIEAAVEKFNLQKYFSVIWSGDYETFGKPHPGIYISAANKLKIDPVYSIAIEDSFNGMISAKAARMKLAAYLDDGRFNDTKYDFADLKLESFHNFGHTELEFLQSLM